MGVKKKGNAVIGTNRIQFSPECKTTWGEPKKKLRLKDIAAESRRRLRTLHALRELLRVMNELENK